MPFTGTSSRQAECKLVENTQGVSDICKQMKLSACKTVQSQSEHVSSHADSSWLSLYIPVREPSLGMIKSLDANVKFQKWVKISQLVGHTTFFSLV